MALTKWEQIVTGTKLANKVASMEWDMMHIATIQEPDAISKRDGFTNPSVGYTRWNNEAIALANKAVTMAETILDVIARAEVLTSVGEVNDCIVAAGYIRANLDTETSRLMDKLEDGVDGWRDQGLTLAQALQDIIDDTSIEAQPEAFLLRNSPGYEPTY